MTIKQFGMGSHEPMITESVGWRRFAARLAEIGADPSDSEEVARAKGLLVKINALIGALSVVWFALYARYEEFVAAALPGGYMVFTVLALWFLARTGRFRLYRVAQLVMMIGLPVALQLALGGFVSGSAVVVWSFFTPLAAFATSSPAEGRRWFLVFLGLVVSAALLEGLVVPGNNLPLGLRDLFFVLNVAGISIVVFVFLDMFVGQLHAERAKSERLLLNVLPPSIAARLRRDPHSVIADRYEHATVLFADIVDFTPLSAALTPEELIDLLNTVFSAFDSLADRHGIEKIKTIGDSYLAAAGVPEPRPDHAQAIAEMALDILEYCRAHRLPGGVPLRFRMGIHTGPLVAGVIGRRKFIYDLWGDVVNTASRMESHGEAGRIQLTEAAFKLLDAHYVCVPRGTVEVKGKGLLATWLLVGRK